MTAAVDQCRAPVFQNRRFSCRQTQGQPDKQLALVPTVNVIFRGPTCFRYVFSALHPTSFNSYFYVTLPLSYLSQHYPFITF